jgi:hypothetical protein
LVILCIVEHPPSAESATKTAACLIIFLLSMIVTPLVEVSFEPAHFARPSTLRLAMGSGEATTAVPVFPAAGLVDPRSIAGDLPVDCRSWDEQPD